MAKKDDVGYVYIFTNESFREGWIKIGKTKNIKKRLNDLDNTSCPLPFDVYATLKTPRYEDAETFVHEYISHFNRDLRVRPNREYFKVSPKEALGIFYQVKRLMNEEGSEITVYDEQAKKYVKQMEKKHIRHDEPTDTPSEDTSKEPAIGTSSADDDSPRLFSMPTLPTYLNNIKSEKTQKVMKEMGMSTDISAITDLQQLTKLREAVKEMERKEKMHHTHSSALSKYMAYIEAGFTLKDMEHDVMLVKGVKPSTARKTQKSEAHIQNQRKKPAPPFKFSMIDMAAGTTITFAPTGVQVKVASDDAVEYKGEVYSLSGFCKRYMPEERRIPAGQYQGPAYFTYQGKTLKKLRKEKEKR